MHPTSKERITWLKARIEVITATIRELNVNAATYLAASDSRAPATALATLQAEHVALLAELRVLLEFWATQPVTGG